MTINKLINENLDLKEQISKLKNELISSKINYEKNITQLNEQNKAFEQTIKINENQIKTYSKEKEITKQKIIEYENRNINLEETIRAIGYDRKYLEVKLNKLKNEINQKNEQIEKILRDQENMINNNIEFKQIINDMKKSIN